MEETRGEQGGCPETGSGRPGTRRKEQIRQDGGGKGAHDVTTMTEKARVGGRLLEFPFNDPFERIQPGQLQSGRGNYEDKLTDECHRLSRPRPLENLRILRKVPRRVIHGSTTWTRRLWGNIVEEALLQPRILFFDQRSRNSHEKNVLQLDDLDTMTMEDYYCSSIPLNSTN
ncbi:uncharacterized protein LOC143149407 [Ptiloglossa arizonensis]|uniref:uncharacterized protein LOC143149407 n=1 Tax=Ptiloglossa arizonensis TaxID=3350558 RepID=UPI003FA11E16